MIPTQRESPAGGMPLELGECELVIEVLAAQLHETSQLIEQSVIKACNTFTNIARRAEQHAIRTKIALLLNDGTPTTTADEVLATGGAVKGQAQVCEAGMNNNDGLEQFNAELKGLVANAITNSTQLAVDLSDAITVLQFQDAVSQQLEHVSSALKDIREVLHRSIGASTTRMTGWIDWLRARYTMQSEQQLLDRFTNSNDSSEGSSTDSIELF